MIEVHPEVFGAAAIAGQAKWQEPVTVRCGAWTLAVIGWGWELNLIWQPVIERWIWHERGNTDDEPQRTSLTRLAEDLGLDDACQADRAKRAAWPHRSVAGVPGVEKVRQRRLAPREDIPESQPENVRDAWSHGITMKDLPKKHDQRKRSKTA